MSMQAPANWKSTQQASYKPGNAQHILSYKETRAKTLGPRARMVGTEGASAHDQLVHSPTRIWVEIGLV